MRNFKTCKELSNLQKPVKSCQKVSKGVKSCKILLADSSEAYGYAELTLPFFDEYVQKFC